MTRTILVAGTASHVGKSTVAAGLCRTIADQGISVAPFKAQNMSNNARVATTPDGDWGEIGVSQYVQARAGRTTPSVDFNPVLLKPRGDGESQLVIHGEAVGNFEAGRYYEDHWERALSAARESYRRLARNHEFVVAEGAGGLGEVNLHDRDLANVETARFADAEVLLLGDIERGGVFASLYGTLELMPDDVRDRVVGTVITKFRGDESLLDPGIEELESRTGVPVLGVVPYDDPGLAAEDSVSLPDVGERRVEGADDGVTDERSVTVAVPRFPRISNATDVEPLARVPGVRIAFVPPNASLDAADAVVLPGSKNTVDDLLALRAGGFDERLRAFVGPVLGICGGYQMLGERLTNADREGTGDRAVVEGIGILPVETRFSGEKRVERVTRRVEGTGPLAGTEGCASGYEIHVGRTVRTTDPREDLAVTRPVGPASTALGNVAGTYLHGLFENECVREAFVDRVYATAGVDRPDADLAGESPHDRAAGLVRDAVDLEALELPANGRQ